MTRLRATVLTIGTEVSNGQIVNSNASWIADQLVNLRIDPVWHLTVPDFEAEMLDALRIAAERCQILLITGGLGPTADDITRQIVARWCDDELVFDPASWTKIEDRFSKLGIPAPPSNRQQCLFPSKARVVDNPYGTANAFHIERKGVQIWCLPGPPDEIKSIWKTSLRADLQELAKGSHAQELLRWQCLGLSESALGEIVEKAIAGSTLTSGYRPHFPYEEIKIWCDESDLKRNRPYLDALDEVLKPWLVGKDDYDCVFDFLNQLRDFRQVWIDDAASYGAIADRIALAWGRAKMGDTQLFFREQFPGSTPLESRTQPPPDVLHLSVSPLDAEGHWKIRWHSAEQLREQELRLAYKRDPKRFERERKFVCEKTLVSWNRAAALGGFRLA